MNGSNLEDLLVDLNGLKQEFKLNKFKLYESQQFLRKVFQQDQMQIKAFLLQSQDFKQSFYNLVMTMEASPDAMINSAYLKSYSEQLDTINEFAITLKDPSKARRATSSNNGFQGLSFNDGQLDLMKVATHYEDDEQFGKFQGSPQGDLLAQQQKINHHQHHTLSSLAQIQLPTQSIVSTSVLDGLFAASHQKEQATLPKMQEKEEIKELEIARNVQRLGSIFDMDLQGGSSMSKGAVLDLPTLPILVPIITGSLTLHAQESTKAKNTVDINELISMDTDEVGRSKATGQPHTPSTQHNVQNQDDQFEFAQEQQPQMPPEDEFLTSTAVPIAPVVQPIITPKLSIFDMEILPDEPLRVSQPQPPKIQQTEQKTVQAPQNPPQLQFEDEEFVMAEEQAKVEPQVVETPKQLQIEPQPPINLAPASPPKKADIFSMDQFNIAYEEPELPPLNLINIGQTKTNSQIAIQPVDLFYNYETPILKAQNDIVQEQRDNQVRVQETQNNVQIDEDFGDFGEFAQETPVDVITQNVTQVEKQLPKNNNGFTLDLDGFLGFTGATIVSPPKVIQLPDNDDEFVEAQVVEAPKDQKHFTSMVNLDNFLKIEPQTQQSRPSITNTIMNTPFKQSEPQLPEQIFHSQIRLSTKPRILPGLEIEKLQNWRKTYVLNKYECNIKFYKQLAQQLQNLDFYSQAQQIRSQAKLVEQITQLNQSYTRVVDEEEQGEVTNTVKTMKEKISQLNRERTQEIAELCLSRNGMSLSAQIANQISKQYPQYDQFVKRLIKSIKDTRRRLESFIQLALVALLLKNTYKQKIAAYKEAMEKVLKQCQNLKSRIQQMDNNGELISQMSSSQFRQQCSVVQRLLMASLRLYQIVKIFEGQSNIRFRLNKVKNDFNGIYNGLNFRQTDVQIPLIPQPTNAVPLQKYFQPYIEMMLQGQQMQPQMIQVCPICLFEGNVHEDCKTLLNL